MKYLFELEKNIFMYNHKIICTHGEKKYEAICESAPKKEKTILFWPDDFDLPPEEKESMMKDFKEWLAMQTFKYIIHEGKGR